MEQKNKVPEGIPFEFTGTARIGERLFHGNAWLRKQNQKNILTGSVFRSSTALYVVFYWVTSLIVAAAVIFLLFSLLLKMGYFQFAPSLKNYTEHPVTILDLLFTGVTLGIGFYAAKYFGKYILQTSASVELAHDEVAAVINEGYYMQKQENKPDVQMCHGAFLMEKVGKKIKFVCRREDISRISALLQIEVRKQK